MDKKIRILFLSANPLGTNVLKLDEEIRAITTKIHAAEYRDKLELISAWAVRPDDLIDLLNRHKPDIVHFSGHGAHTGEILLVDNNNLPKPVAVKALNSLFKTLKDNVRIVILNACYSFTQAEAVNKNVDFVIGMSDAIQDDAAIVFSASFYRAIGFGRTIQESFDQALTALLMEGIFSENIPQLLVRPGCSPDQRILSLAETRTTSEDRSPLMKRDWDMLPVITNFWGRENELKTLEQWVFQDKSKVVAILGMGGIGKSSLVSRFIRSGQTGNQTNLGEPDGILADKFEFVIWKRLLNAPQLTELLPEMLGLLSGYDNLSIPQSVHEQTAILLGYLRAHRCFIVFDNFEAVLESRDGQICYRAGHEVYEEFINQISNVEHQSCLVITSREKPTNIVLQDGPTRPVQSLELKGLDEADARHIFQKSVGFSGSETGISTLVNLYAGNPLALELVAKHISEVFFGDIQSFLREGKPIFLDINDLLRWHFERLSPYEKEVLYWLAINREPVSFGQLREDLLSADSKSRLSSTLQNLQRKIPLEKLITSFTIQPVLVEFMTEQLVEQVDSGLKIQSQTLVDVIIRDFVRESSKNLQSNPLELLNTHALLKSSSKEWIRDAQKRLILEPIIQNLVNILPKDGGIPGHFKKLLSLLREKHPHLPGYLAGNIFNLLCILDVGLKGYDFSSLCLWQANFQGVELYDINFAGADFKKCRFTDTFGVIYTTAFNPAGNLLAAGTLGGNIKLWDTSDYHQVHECKGHSVQVNQVVFSEDGSLLASCSHDKTIRIWETTHWSCQLVISEPKSSVLSISFSPDGTTLACGCMDKAVQFYNVKSGKQVRGFEAHDGWVMSVAFSPDSKILASAGDDQKVKLWDAKTGKLLRSLNGHTGKVRAVAFHLGNKILATGSSDHSIRLWDIKSGNCVKLLVGHSDRVRAVAFSRDGENLLSGSNDQTVRVWNVHSGQCVTTLSGHSNWVETISISKENLIASGSSDQTIALWDAKTGEKLRVLVGYRNPVKAVAINQAGDLLACGNQSLTVQLWNLHAKGFYILKGHKNWVWAAEFSPSGELLATGSGDKTVRLWNPKTGKTLVVLDEHTNRVRTVAFSKSRKMLASSGGDRSIKLWDAESFQKIKELNGHLNWVQSIAFSPDGQYLASASTDKTIRLWNVDSGECEGVLTDHTDWVMSVSFDILDGNILASGSNDRTIRLWDVKKHASIHVFDVDFRVNAIKFSPEQHYLAVCGESPTILLYDTQKFQVVGTFKGHEGNVSSVAFRSDGKWLVSGGDDQTIRIWDVENKRCDRIFHSNRPYDGMNISNISGLSEADVHTLMSLGAVQDTSTEPS